MNKSHLFILLKLISSIFMENFCSVNILTSGSANTIIQLPVTINNPGIYILNKNLSGTITIGSDRVTLDLGNNILTGTSFGVVVANQTDITIKNGAIQNSSASAISINNSKELLIENIDFISNFTGVFATTSTDITIKECRFYLHSGVPVGFLDSSNIVIHNSFFSNNTVEAIVSITNSICGHIENIKACGNNFLSTSTAYGFFIANAKNINFEHCFVEQNSFDNQFVYGWYIDNSDALTLTHCFFKDNSLKTGTTYASGFFCTKQDSLAKASIFFKKCAVNSNICTNPIISSSATIEGFRLPVNGSCSQCEFNSNFMSLSNLSLGILKGFDCASSGTCYLQSCNVNANETDMIGSYTLVAFSDGSPSLDMPSLFIDQCFVQSNSIHGPSYGFLVQNKTLGAIQNSMVTNIGDNNFGYTFDNVEAQMLVQDNIFQCDSQSSLSYGFSSTSTLTTFFSNISRGAGADNFIGISFSIIDTFNVLTSSFTSTSLLYQNISII